MKRLLVPRIRPHRQPPIDAPHRPQYRPTKLHPALDHARLVRTDDPQRRVSKCDVVEPEPELGVGRVCERVDRAEVVDDVGVWEGRDQLRLKAFEEDDCGRRTRQRKEKRNPLIWFVSMLATSPGPKSNSDTSVERDSSQRVASVMSYSTGTGSVSPSPKNHSCQTQTHVRRQTPGTHTPVEQRTSHRIASSVLLALSSSLKYATKSSFHCCVVILCPMNLCT
jgi:hypothetical protein